MNTVKNWSAPEYCLSTQILEPDSELAALVYSRVCRSDFSAPGFLLINLGRDCDSHALRQFMFKLKGLMRRIYQAQTGRDLVYLSAARFDQQSTTKLHRDGGPDECFLMLGYEPSQVRAAVAISDYSQCAHEMGLTPSEFLERHNPMFRTGEELLRPFTTSVDCFSNFDSQILLINNSMTAFSDGNKTWQGVLHTATIENPSDDLRRVINSTMIAAVPM